MRLMIATTIISSISVNPRPRAPCFRSLRTLHSSLILDQLAPGEARGASGSGALSDCNHLARRGADHLDLAPRGARNATAAARRGTARRAARAGGAAARAAGG